MSDPLFELPETTGDVCAAVVAALDALGDDLEESDQGLKALAVAVARSVDVAARKGDVYAVATASRELRECLAALRMTPAARSAGGAGDPVLSLVDAWAGNASR